MTWVAYHVWALGKLSGEPHFSIVNNCGPLLPYNSLNPFMGTREVPVTNCRSLALISLLKERTTYIESRNINDNIFGKKKKKINK
jgi:hypothetical protein